MHSSPGRARRRKLQCCRHTRSHASGGIHLTTRELAALRTALDKTDADILALVAQRADIASEIGLVKEKDSHPVRDALREREVRDRFAETSRSLGLDESKTQALVDLLIEIAVSVQKKKHKKSLEGASILVVGGSGRMGEWTCRFLSNRGAKVKVWDPRGELEGYHSVRSVLPWATSSDMVVIASPLGKCQEELEQVLKCSPKGLVFDLCSVKSHMYGMLKKAASQGILITSVHPMFGPSAATPRGRNVIVCDCGNEKANKLAENLFKEEGARVSTIPLDKHDDLMSYVLGLSHLCSLLFAGTLVKSGKSTRELSRIEGTSFLKMTRMARELTNESKRVYHDIQSLNPHTRHMVATMEGVLRELKKASLDADSDGFSKIMESDRKYLEV